MNLPKYSDISVIKKSGKKEPFQPQKIINHLERAVDGISYVNISDILENFRMKLSTEIHSRDIQTLLIQTAHELISEDTPEYEYVAARLLNQQLRDDVHGQYNTEFNFNTIKERIDKGFYDPILLDFFDPEDINDLCRSIKYKRDDNFTYMGLKHTINKYLIKNKNKRPIETPQEAFLLIPMYIFGYKYGYDKRHLAFPLIKKFYNALSNFEIMLSTPPMVGIRTKMRGYTSCAGIDFGDSIESIGNGMKSMLTLVTKLRAGIGGNAGHIRGVGADINDGMEKHTGLVPYLKPIEYLSKSSQQPMSGRSGAVTFYYPFFHWEIENILQLKNNRGQEAVRVRHSDHAIIFNDLFYERMENDEDITLFHMNDVGDLYEKIGFYEDFKEKYEELEKREDIEKRTISARVLYETFWNERYSINRLYKVNADEMQNHSAFRIPTYVSNLCTEINLPSFPDEELYFDCDLQSQKEVEEAFYNLYAMGEWYNAYEVIKYGEIPNEITEFWIPGLRDSKNGKFHYNFGEIFACILGGVNMKSPIERLPELMNLMVRFLDAMIDMQDYKGVWAFEKAAKNRRALGISPSNFFYALAERGYQYNTKKARDFVAEYMENMLYWGLKASVDIAKEEGACLYFNDTKYFEGILPIDSYNKNIDKLLSKKMYLPKEMWDSLREDIKNHGLRNSTILTAVPASNSSRVSNSISGINPPQSLIYTIEDKKVSLKAALPKLRKFKKFYDECTVWKIDMVEYYKTLAVFQKYIDQGMSINDYVDFTKFKNRKIPLEEVIKKDYCAQKYGLKTVYYVKSKTDNQEQEEIQDESNCSGGGCEL